jgi:hypothetical protein
MGIGGVNMTKYTVGYCLYGAVEIEADSVDDAEYIFLTMTDKSLVQGLEEDPINGYSVEMTQVTDEEGRPVWEQS